MRYKCPYCPKTFRDKEDLVAHAKRIHGLSIATLKKLSEEEKTDLLAQCLEIMNEMDKDGVDITKERVE